MRNLASILVLVFAFTLTTQAQKKSKKKRVQLSIEQQTDLAVKKMTLVLDLSEKQQNQITPLVKTQISERKVAMEKRRAARKDKQKPTADEIYAMKSKQLDAKILTKKRFKEILNKEQFEKFVKMRNGRKKMAMKKVKGMKKKYKKTEESK